jgi:putative membrane protein
MDYDTLKSLHIIFVVTWFAALFYMPRLFVYDIEAREKPKEEQKILLKQLQIMQRRLWMGIAWPSMILTLILGTWLTLQMGLDLSYKWLVLKLILVILLCAYHIACHFTMLQLSRNEVKFSSQGMRLWNEIPTIVLFGVVFLVVTKNTDSLWHGSLMLLGLIVMIVLGVRLYKAYRSRLPNQ